MNNDTHTDGFNRADVAEMVINGFPELRDRNLHTLLNDLEDSPSWRKKEFKNILKQSLPERFDIDLRGKDSKVTTLAGMIENLVK